MVLIRYSSNFKTCNSFWVVAQLLIWTDSTIGYSRSTAKPDDTEYDFAILDPDSPFGSPYGGYGRATGSRLSSLGLKLPNVVNSVGDFEPFFFQVRDYSGRSFSCRSYHEDELDPKATEKGMFELALYPAKVSASNGLETTESKTRLWDGLYSVEGEVVQKISSLKGVCAQIHQGWWSYEWCYEGKVTQFHVEIHDSNSKEKIFSLEDITSLGDFKERSIIPSPASKASLSEESSQPTRTDHNQNAVEVREVFLGGDVCLDTGRRRETTVFLQCCPDTIAAKRKGTVMQKAVPRETDLLYIQSVTESADHTCVYTMTICTLLLCDLGPSRTPEQTAPPPSTLALSVGNNLHEAENLSISEILELSFFRTRKKCIQFGTGAW